VTVIAKKIAGVARLKATDKTNARLTLKKVTAAEALPFRGNTNGATQNLLVTPPPIFRTPLVFVEALAAAIVIALAMNTVPPTGSAEKTLAASSMLIVA